MLDTPLALFALLCRYTNIVGLQGGVNGFLRVFDARLNPKGALCCWMPCNLHGEPMIKDQA